VLVLNGAIMVYLFERQAPGSNIHTLGESPWWSVVMVTTVGDGDYIPVTVDGRITAGCIMVIGLLTLAVVNAQVASSFVAQGTSRDQRSQQIETAPPEVTLAEARPAADPDRSAAHRSCAVITANGRSPGPGIRRQPINLARISGVRTGWVGSPR
jgi:voltage-gated potassium channel